MFKYKVKKGDTLNGIAKQHGFNNYQDAGITSVASGNFDLINPDEEITLGNYNPNNVQNVQEGSPVISSEDDAQGYKDNVGKLAEQKESNNPEYQNDDYFIDDEGQVAGGSDGGEREKINTIADYEKSKFKADSMKKQKEYDKMFQTNLRNIDNSTDATINRIQQTYGKRLDEQSRINDLNIARVKAYGLGGGGSYTPISYGDSVTNREREASDEIRGIESQRNSLIREAQFLADDAKSALLEDRMSAIDALNNRINTGLERIEKEAEAQYTLLRDLRSQEEEKHQAQLEEMQKRFASLAPLFIDEFEDQDNAGRQEMAIKYAEEYGLNPADIFGTMFEKMNEKIELDGDQRLQDAKVKSEGALQAQRYASANNSNANADKARNGKDEEERLEDDLPENFLDDEDAERKRKTFVKKHGTKGQAYWEATFQNPTSDIYDYEFSEEGGDIKSRVNNKGYNYDAMIAEGWTDEDIEEALSQ